MSDTYKTPGGGFKGRSGGPGRAPVLPATNTALYTEDTSHSASGTEETSHRASSEAETQMKHSPIDITLSKSIYSVRISPQDRDHL